MDIRRAQGLYLVMRRMTIEFIYQTGPTSNNIENFLGLGLWCCYLFKFTFTPNHYKKLGLSNSEV